MRGGDTVAELLFSYVGLEERVRADHSLQVIYEVVNSVLVTLSAEFDVLYLLPIWVSIHSEGMPHRSMSMPSFPVLVVSGYAPT